MNPLNDKAMKRRLLMVSAMILLLGSQVQMYAQKNVGPNHNKPAFEMHEGKKAGHPMKKRSVTERDIKRLQDVYWQKYHVRLSKRDAERILREEMRDRKPGPPPPNGPHRPQWQNRPQGQPVPHRPQGEPKPQGQQKPPVPQSQQRPQRQ